MAKKKADKYYSLENILKQEADYNVIYGERSNGKTTAVLEYALEDHINSDYKNQLGIIRRWPDDYVGKNGKQLFEGIVRRGKIESLTNGKYNSVYYYGQRWFLCKYDEAGNKVAQAEFPFAIGFALTNEEHYKSTAYPDINIILFDEFISRRAYLPDEFICFQNLLSTIIRLRDNVKIFMCGNTINKFCPYFNEMGLTGVKKQTQGTIDVYTYGESTLRVAVEYSDFPSKEKASNKYFAFNNPKLQMITHGGWEIDIYPHLPRKYLPKDVVYHFYICFDEYILRGNIIEVDDELFIYIHQKTTPIRADNEQLVYQLEVNYKRNYRHNLFHGIDKPSKVIAELFQRKKVFYQDNEIGEIVNNFIKQMGT